MERGNGSGGGGAMILNIILTIFISLLFPCFYFLYRNSKVCDYRTNLLMSDYERYKQLPSYDEMLYKFWRKIESWPGER